MAETFRSLSSGQELSIAVEFAPKYFQKHFHFFANIFIILIRTNILDTKNTKKTVWKKRLHGWIELFTGITNMVSIGFFSNYFSHKMANKITPSFHQASSDPKKQKRVFRTGFCPPNHAQSTQLAEIRRLPVSNRSGSFCSVPQLTFCPILLPYGVCMGYSGIFSRLLNFGGIKNIVPTNMFWCPHDMLTLGT